MPDCRLLKGANSSYHEVAPRSLWSNVHALITRKIMRSMDAQCNTGRGITKSGSSEAMLSVTLRSRGNITHCFLWGLRVIIKCFVIPPKSKNYCKHHELPKKKICWHWLEQKLLHMHCLKVHALITCISQKFNSCSCFPSRKFICEFCVSPELAREL